MKNKIKMLMICVMVIIANVNSLFCQSTIANNSLSGTAPNPVEFLGSDNGFDLVFNFGGIGGIGEVARFLQSNGNLGIGTNNPQQLLHVSNSGSIRLDVTGVGESFMINTNPVLWHNNNTSNIFVGVGAGISNTPTDVNNTFIGNNAGNNTATSGTARGSHNTFVGNNTGFTNTIGYGSTMVGIEAGFNNTTGKHNNFIGDSAGFSNVTGWGNWFGGYAAGFANIGAAGFIGNWNTYTGHKCGQNNPDGKLNCYYGKEAGFNSTEGEGNCFYGVRSGFVNKGNRAVTPNHEGWDNCFYGHYSGGGVLDPTDATTGSQNCYYGNYAGERDHTGEHNCFFGFRSGSDNDGGNYNSFYGHRSGRNNVTGHYNIFIGDEAAFNNLEGDSNVVIGYDAGRSLVGDDNNSNPDTRNVFIGPQAALSTTGEENIIIGSLANGVPVAPAIFLTNATAIGADAVVRRSNTMILGRNDVNVGIGLSGDATGPVAKLHVDNQRTNIAGMFRSSTNPINWNQGVYALAEQGGFANVGLTGDARTAQIAFPSSLVNIFNFWGIPYNIGTVGRARGSFVNIGGVFEANDPTCQSWNVGMYASASACNTTATAGFFQGFGFSTAPILAISDHTFKDSIQTLTGALTTIARLNPKNFVFKTSTYPYMNLAPGQQHGFISQEIDTVMPELVHEVMQPQIRDSLGNILQDTITIKALDYTSLIPLAIAGIQELSTTKVSACSDPTVADSNQLVKWSGSEKVLCNSIIYDDGERVGIPSTEPYAYVNVSNHQQQVAGHFTSDAEGTTAVLAAEYDEDGGGTEIPAVAGYSKYVNSEDADDGIGGTFLGGLRGVDARADGNNEMEFGVMGQSKNASFANVGVGGAAISPTDSVNIGVLAGADSAAWTNAAIIATSEGVSSTAVNVGILAFASGSANENFGGRFEITDNTGTNYVVYAAAPGSASTSYAGYFDGDVHSTGTVTWTSDARLKNNIQDIDSANALEQLLRLQPKTYEYRRADYPTLTLPQGTQYGLLAQDVEQVFPQLVSDVIQPAKLDKYGRRLSEPVEYKGLNYVGLIPMLISALKEEHAKNEEMENRLEELEARMNTCCQRGAAKTDENDGGNDNTNRMTVELSSMQVIVLEQNVPNPFAEQTSISYFIPDDVRSAQIIFSDMLGRNIKTVEVTLGYGIMTVFASNLSSGQYTYSLLIDGKVEETKKMSKGK